MQNYKPCHCKPPFPRK